MIKVYRRFFILVFSSFDDYSHRFRNFTLIYEICLVKENFSSMITSMNFVKVTRSKEMLLKVILMLLCLSRADEKSHNVIFQSLELVC